MIILTRIYLITLYSHNGIITLIEIGKLVRIGMIIIYYKQSMHIVLPTV